MIINVCVLCLFVRVCVSVCAERVSLRRKKKNYNKNGKQEYFINGDYFTTLPKLRG